MNKPTKLQIDGEVSELRALLPRLPRHNFFGDAIHEAVEAQIRVLSVPLSFDDVHDIFGETAFLDTGKFDQYVFDEALTASDWATGTLSDEFIAPSESWKEVAR